MVDLPFAKPTYLVIIPCWVSWASESAFPGCALYLPTSWYTPPHSKTKPWKSPNPRSKAPAHAWCWLFPYGRPSDRWSRRLLLSGWRCLFGSGSPVLACLETGCCRLASRFWSIGVWIGWAALLQISQPSQCALSPGKLPLHVGQSTSGTKESAKMRKVSSRIGQDQKSGFRLLFPFHCSKPEVWGELVWPWTLKNSNPIKIVLWLKRSWARVSPWIRPSCCLSQSSLSSMSWQLTEPSPTRQLLELARELLTALAKRRDRKWTFE